MSQLPSDLVMADGDGVVVVTRERAEEVAKAAMQFLDAIGLERAKARAAKEKREKKQ